MYTVSGRSNGLNDEVYMFKNNVWTVLGKMTEAQSTGSSTGGKIVGGFAYTGDKYVDIFN